MKAKRLVRIQYYCEGKDTGTYDEAHRVIYSFPSGREYVRYLRRRYLVNHTDAGIRYIKFDWMKGGF